jgi:hypothetical protein
MDSNRFGRKRSFLNPGIISDFPEGTKENHEKRQSLPRFEPRISLAIYTLATTSIRSVFQTVRQAQSSISLFVYQATPLDVFV